MTDAGLVHLIGLPKLVYLDLDDAQVSDAGVAHLSRMSTLMSLHLYGTNISDAGFAELEQALPNCTIER